MMSETGNVSIMVEKVIKAFMESSENRLGMEPDEPAWAEPLVGFSSGADPLYRFYKQDIGESHYTPLELFQHHFSSTSSRPEDLSVISWVLPQTDATKADQRVEIHFPSERWARSRIFGEKVNDKLRRHVVDTLGEKDVEAIAPLLSPLYKSIRSKRYGKASTWSERHAAYAAGLGTFGLSDGLITTVGKAIRVGSVVARITVPPSKRPYEDHHAYCLFHTKGICGECMDRCPVGAISREGHDKELCSRYLRMTRAYVERHFGFKGYGCGLCQTGVACESSIPRGIEVGNRDIQDGR